MSLNDLKDSATSILGTFAGVVLVLLFVLQKMKKSWISTDAETDVVKLLRDEVERLSKQNTNLSVHLFAMQQQLGELQKRNGYLSRHVERLEEEVKQLKGN